MKRIIAVILALCMLFPMLVSCSKSKGKDETETDTNVETKGENSETNVETENDLVNAGLPENLDFGESTVNIVTWKAYNPEFILDADSLDGDPVLDAVYKRELYTENLLNVKIECIINDYIGNSGGQMQTWCNKLKDIMDDPSTPVDLFASYSRILATATVNGLNQDLTQYDNLDFSKDWWPKNIQKEFSLKDKLYIASGDIASGIIFNMYCVFYNRTMIQQLGKEDPVQLVRDKEWTIDKLIEMTTGVFEDCDGVDGLTPMDKTGITLDYWCFDPIVQGAGFKILESSKEDGKYMQITEDFTSKKFDAFVSKMGKWAVSDDVFCSRNDNETGHCGPFFIEGRSLFHVNSANLGSQLQSKDINYGILPPPMLDPVQQNGEYVTTLGNPYTIFSMARNCPDGERAAAVLQTLGYYGMKFTTPAVFDITMKGKYAKLEEVAEMFEVVRKAISFDLGLLYMRELDSINDKASKAIANNGQWLGSYMNTFIQNALDKLLTRLNKKLDAVVNS